MISFIFFFFASFLDAVTTYYAIDSGAVELNSFYRMLLIEGSFWFFFFRCIIIPGILVCIVDYTYLRKYDSLIYQTFGFVYLLASISNIYVCFTLQ